jgi:hypothetical protein
MNDRALTPRSRPAVAATCVAFPASTPTRLANTHQVSLPWIVRERSRGAHRGREQRAIGCRAATGTHPTSVHLVSGRRRDVAPTLTAEQGATSVPAWSARSKRRAGPRFGAAESCDRRILALEASRQPSFEARWSPFPASGREGIPDSGKGIPLVWSRREAPSTHLGKGTHETRTGSLSCSALPCRADNRRHWPRWKPSALGRRPPGRTRCRHSRDVREVLS